MDSSWSDDRCPVGCCDGDPRLLVLHGRGCVHLISLLRPSSGRPRSCIQSGRSGGGLYKLSLDFDHGSFSHVFAAFRMQPKFLGLLCVLSLFLLISRTNLRGSLDRVKVSGPLAALMIALCPGIQMWAVAGLETILFSTCLIAAIYFHESGIKSSGFFCGVCFGLSTLTRPEGACFFLLFLLSLIVFQRKQQSGWLNYLAGFCLIVLPHAIFRLIYYNSWIPNTFWVKSHRYQGGGIAYFKRYIAMTGMWMIPAALIGLGSRRSRQLILPMMVMSLGYLGYVFIIGGDWMPFGRFLIPVLPLIALSATRAMVTAERRVIRIILAGMLVLNMITASCSAKYDLIRIRPSRYREILTWEMEHMRDWRVVGEWLRLRISPEETLCTGLAGVIPYYSGLRTLDRGGLNDRQIARIIFRSETKDEENQAIREVILDRLPDIVMIESSSFNMLKKEPVFSEQIIANDDLMMDRYEVKIEQIGDRYFTYLKLRKQGSPS